MAKSATGSNKLLFFLIFVAALMVGGAVTNFFFVARYAENDNAFFNYVAEQAVLSQSLAKNATLGVSTGNREAYQELATNRDRFERTLEFISTGGPNLPRATGAVKSEIDILVTRWRTVREAINKVTNGRDGVLVSHGSAATVREQMPQLLVEYDEIAKMLAAANSPRDTVYHISRQGLFGQRIARDIDTLVTGAGGNVTNAANRLNGDVSYFNRVMRGLFDGEPELNITRVTDDAVRTRLTQASTILRRLDEALQTVISMESVLAEVHGAIGVINDNSDELLNQVRTVENTYRREADQRVFKATYGYAFGIGALVVVIAMIYLFVLTSDTRKAAALQAEQQERNQEAILRLLDELGSLADGDLTVQATVTEDITGAIADSINYAIEALRDLVVTINDTALQVDSTAKQTQATASHLLQASENQTKQITSATQKMSQMATSVEQVSANAERSTKVAQQSVEIAHKGGEAVRATIDGMNSIRETIQETSKRIKRLGESSQEIGDIVELINDIAEQTNILALNAAIQASMAGEAGRGFAVVADEVQRLAERSGNATRQIEALVKTIQTDTNEAVISMEQSTAGVVNGAQLAENAGAALDEIEKVSNHIATLIQSISSAARQQATAAADVSKTMNVIQDITKQTTEGTQITARNIGKLANLAGELRKSVAGFKLPGMGAGETLVMTQEEHA